MRTLLLCAAFLLSGKTFADCKFHPQASGLEVRDGFLEFIPPSDLKPFKDALPSVTHAETQSALSSRDTIWYDENSMVFLYQDSIEVVTGGRANCVGRMVGERNAGSVIGKLMNYFGPDYRFLFPFRKAAGTDNVENVKVLNFWVPPRTNGKALPVKYWRPTSRGRWYWTFPKNTLFGEVLFQKSPNGNWFLFEVRTRKRYLDGWEVNLFRPFLTATSMANQIEALRPQWKNSPNLSSVVNHLNSPQTLKPAKWESKPFAKVFQTINGALDPIPAIDDVALVEALLKTPFKSAEGSIWKENGSLQSYAPGSEGTFSIVPKGYEMGIIPVNEVSCNRCHSETGRRLGEFEFDIILYGEIWGEDRIFTWHLFQPQETIYDTWDDADGSRKLNPRLVQAGLVVNQKPGANDPDYKPLPSAFVPESSRKQPQSK